MLAETWKVYLYISTLNYLRFMEFLLNYQAVWQIEIHKFMYLLFFFIQKHGFLPGM
jgi:hypothetical protein